MSATLFPLHQLMAPQEYHQKNHILSADNWFMSPEWIVHCIDKGIHAIGTCRVNRKNTPKEGIFPLKGNGKRNRGEIKVMMTDLINGALYFTTWRDNKPVHLLNTYKTGVGQVTRRSKNNTRAFFEQQILRPTIISDYNAGMGGTDKGDQPGSYFRDEHRTIKWSCRTESVQIVTHFLMSTVANTYMIYGERQELRDLGLLEYIDALIDDLTRNQTNIAVSEDDELALHPPQSVEDFRDGKDPLTTETALLIPI